jgi:sulfhydrogenase subunit beta (sulfur reductase)
MGILDRVLLGGSRSDPGDRVRTEDLFIVAVQCAQAGGTCFCVSMKTGPVAEAGFDPALTEVLDDEGHHFGHCQLGATLVCRDGPVYRWSELEPWLAIREL